MKPEDVESLVNSLRRKLGSAWADMLEWMRKNNKLGDVIKRLERGDVTGALAHIGTAATKFAQDVNGAYTLSGQRAARWLDGEVGEKLIRFDVTNERAVSWMRQNTLELVKGIGDETRAVAHAALTQGLERGDNPKVIAKEMLDSLGLTPHQMDQVRSYRRALEGGDFSNALDRQLADGRHDRTLIAAQRDDKALSRKQIDTMVDRYRANAVKLRAETIARTEAIRSAHQGQHELFQDAVSRGDIGEQSIVRQWNHRMRGKHNREFHHVMNGQRRGLEEPFMSGLGNEIMFPGDPEAPAVETINCRCVVSVRYVRNTQTAATMRAATTAPLVRRAA